MAIVKANYVCRAKGAPKAAHRACKYYTFREGPDLDLRRWQAFDGRTLSYTEVNDEVRQHAKAYGYTYRLMLSTKDATLTPTEYQAALGDQFTHAYLIEHHNTDYPHAHIIAFSKTQIGKTVFRAMRERLVALEQERVAQQERAVVLPEHAQATITRQQERGRQQEYGIE